MTHPIQHIGNTILVIARSRPIFALSDRCLALYERELSRTLRFDCFGSRDELQLQGTNS